MGSNVQPVSSKGLCSFDINVPTGMTVTAVLDGLTSALLSGGDERNKVHITYVDV